LIETLNDSAFPLFMGINKNKYFLKTNEQNCYNTETIYYCLDTKCIIYDSDSINDIL